MPFVKLVIDKIVVIFRYFDKQLETLIVFSNNANLRQKAIEIFVIKIIN
jgi:hypothetical protein